MSLTRRQKWRIEKVQSERIARANKASTESKKNITNEEALYLWNMGVNSIFSDDPIDILKTE